MKKFYIETDRLTKYDRMIRYYFEENEAGEVKFIKLTDPKTQEEVSLKELVETVSIEDLANIITAHQAPYEHVYLD
jgi:hypothetical protein